MQLKCAITFAYDNSRSVAAKVDEHMEEADSTVVLPESKDSRGDDRQDGQAGTVPIDDLMKMYSAFPYIFIRVHTKAYCKHSACNCRSIPSCLSIFHPRDRAGPYPSAERCYSNMC